LLQIILTVLLIRRRPELKKLAWLLGGMVATQALLGAITVAYKLPWYVSTAHLMLAMSYFATLVYTAFRTRPAPSVVEIQQHERRLDKLGETRTWIRVAVGAVAVQLLLGALVRHHGAALACVGMPTCNIGGGWFPAAGIQKLHMIHRAFGVLVGLVTICAAIQVLRAARSWPALRTLAFLAPILVLGQIALGIATVMTLRSVPVAVGHFAGATALWALWISALLLTRPRTTSTARSSTSATLSPALVAP
jgi:cytochrome c oxidase assembly protein subunit 15